MREILDSQCKARVRLLAGWGAMCAGPALALVVSDVGTRGAMLRVVGTWESWEGLCVRLALGAITAYGAGLLAHAACLRVALAVARARRK